MLFSEVSPIYTTQLLTLKAPKWYLTFHLADWGHCSYNNGFLFFPVLRLQSMAFMAANISWEKFWPTTKSLSGVFSGFGWNGLRKNKWQIKRTSRFRKKLFTILIELSNIWSHGLFRNPIALMVFLSNQRYLNTLRKSKSNIGKDAMMRLFWLQHYILKDARLWT